MEAAVDKRSPSSCCSDAIAAARAAGVADPTVAGKLITISFLIGTLA